MVYGILAGLKTFWQGAKHSGGVAKHSSTVAKHSSRVTDYSGRATEYSGRVAKHSGILARVVDHIPAIMSNAAKRPRQNGQWLSVRRCVDAHSQHILHVGHEQPSLHGGSIGGQTGHSVLSVCSNTGRLMSDQSSKHTPHSAGGPSPLASSGTSGCLKNIESSISSQWSPNEAQNYAR